MRHLLFLTLALGAIACATLGSVKEMEVHENAFKVAACEGSVEKAKESMNLRGGVDAFKNALAYSLNLDRKCKSIQTCNDSVVKMVISSGVIPGQTHYQGNTHLDMAIETECSNFISLIAHNSELEDINSIRVNVRWDEPEKSVNIYDAIILGIQQKCGPTPSDECVTAREKAEKKRAEFSDRLQEKNESKLAEAREEEEIANFDKPSGLKKRACYAQELIKKYYSAINHEKEASKISGYVNMSLLHSMGVGIHSAKKSIKKLKINYRKKTGSEIDLSNCAQNALH